MDIGPHGFSNLANAQSVHSRRNSIYSVSTSDENCHLLQSQNFNSNIFNDISSDISPEFTGMNHMHSDQFSQNHHYFQNSLVSLSSRFNSFSQIGQSSSRKHLLSGVVRTRRRKAGINDEDRVCIVCGEPASGYNFDRLTCESCKAFFRRNALKSRDKIKACNRGGGCAIEGNQRKHCPSCRLEKCLAVGMKRELILPPEKLEQRAKPRRRKRNSPQDSSSPQHALTGPSSVGSNSTNIYPLMSSPHSVQVNSGHPSISYNSLVTGSNIPLHFMNPLDFTNFLNTNQTNNMSNIAENYSSTNLENKVCNFNEPNLSKLDSIQKSDHNFTHLVNQHLTDSRNMLPTGFSRLAHTNHKLKSCKRPSTCLRSNGRTYCKHRNCRLLARRKLHKHRHNLKMRRNLVKNVLYQNSLIQPDRHLLKCLEECIRRIREPFTPEEQLETGVAVTLEQEYNRMDACIRRIIRVVKLLPYFGDVGKPAQLRLLRTNIYGLIVLYSSFFFERDIRKLRYPVLQSDGKLTTVTVSMLDEVITPSNSSSNSDDITTNEVDQKLSSSINYLRSAPRNSNHYPCPNTYAVGLREEFELYKANTLAAFDHLDQLIRFDDVLRMCIMAIKLFTDSLLPDDMRELVCSARNTYLVFLWNYIRCRAGSKKVYYATDLYSRLLISFIDLRTLEIRMTEFAKLLSLDGLSPLMREVCSQRNTLGS